MATLKMMPTDEKWWRENVGRGGAIPLGMKQEPKSQNLSEQNLPPQDSRLELQKEIDQIFREAKESGNVAFPSEQTAESKSTTGDDSDASRK